MVSRGHGRRDRHGAREARLRTRGGEDVVVDLSCQHAMDVTLFLATELGEWGIGDGPDADGAVGGGGDERAGVGSEGDGDNAGAVARGDGREVAGFVIEYLYDAVGAGDGDGGTVGVGDGESRELGVGGIVDDAKRGGVRGVPPGYLAVGSRGNDLFLVGMYAYGFKVRRTEERDLARAAKDVPDDARAVVRGGDGGGVVVEQGNVVHGRSVFFHGRLERDDAAVNHVPQSHITL